MGTKEGEGSGINLTTRFSSLGRTYRYSCRTSVVHCSCNTTTVIRGKREGARREFAKLENLFDPERKTRIRAVELKVGGRLLLSNALSR